MRWLKRVIVAIVVLVAALVVIGYLLPSDYVVRRSIVIHAPPEKIYPLVATPKRWADWSVWTRRDPAMKITYFGPESGAGAGWQWDSKTEGQGKMTLTKADPKDGMAYDLYFPEYDSTSSGVMAFTPDADGTRVTWTNEGSMGANPFMHFMGLAMDRMVGKDFEGGLANLKARAEAP
jgi:uncharacterized protein YndB with AHSA1/START domain